MIYFTDNELQKLVEDDVPYFDLTTHLQNIQDKTVTLEIFTRETIVVACSDDAKRVAEIFGCSVIEFAPPGTKRKAGERLIAFEGDYNSVQRIYKSIQILLEYSCKMATHSSEMKAIIDANNPHCELLATRKNFPFSKKLSQKSIMTGGAMPHRLGLSETILFFTQHRIVYANSATFYEALKEIKQSTAEKKIVVESQEFEDAKALMQNGADVLQIEKASIELLEGIVSYKNKYHKEVKILATGGIKKENVAAFAQSGVDGIVTSSLYNCGMADLGSRIIEKNMVNS